MKKAILAICFLLFVITAAAFAVPGYINYQGVLRNSAGDLQTGTFNMQFKIYSALTGGTLHYDSEARSVSVSNGVFSIELGEIPNPETVFDGNPKYIETIVDSETLSPRLKINTVAYAIRADVAGSATSATTATHATTADSATSAEAVADNSISTAKIQNDAVDGDKLADNINISTTGNITGNKFTFTSLATSGAGCVGTAEVGNTSSNVTVNNSYATENSIILLTPLISGATPTKALKVKGRATGSFVVYTLDELAIGGAETLPFMYLIIN